MQAIDEPPNRGSEDQYERLSVAVLGLICFKKAMWKNVSGSTCDMLKEVSKESLYYTYKLLEVCNFVYSTQGFKSAGP